MQWKCREPGERSGFEKMGAKVIGQREGGREGRMEKEESMGRGQ